MYILNFLRKHARATEVDFARIIDAIPDDFPVVSESLTPDSSDLDSSSVFSFLSSVTSHILHQKRVYECTKELSQIDFINAKGKLVEAKQAYVIIRKATKCAKCEMTIGDKQFVVFPNGIVTQTCCYSDKEVCPITNRNFVKTFRK
jgi:hypothetical protein